MTPPDFVFHEIVKFLDDPGDIEALKAVSVDAKKAVDTYIRVTRTRPVVRFLKPVAPCTLRRWLMHFRHLRELVLNARDRDEVHKLLDLLLERIGADQKLLPATVERVEFHVSAPLDRLSSRVLHKVAEHLPHLADLVVITRTKTRHYRFPKACNLCPWCPIHRNDLCLMNSLLFISLRA